MAGALITRFAPASPGARFALRFGVIASALFALYTFPYAENGVRERFFEAYLAAYARVVGALLALFEPSVSVSGSLVVGRFSMQIAKSCDAGEVLILFVAAVVALPVPWKRSAPYALGGVLALMAVNVVRIVSLYYVGVRAPGAFETLHLEVWPLLLVTLGSVGFLAVTVRLRGDSTSSYRSVT